MEVGKHHSITITTGTIVKSLLFVLLIGLLYFIRDIVLVVLTAVVIASALEPFTRKFEEWKIPRIPAVMLVYLSIVLLITSCLYFVVPVFLEDVSSLLTLVPQYLQSTSVVGEGSVVQFLGSAVAPANFSFADLANEVRTLLTGVSQGTWGIFLSFSGGVLSFILIFVLSFYLAVQKTGVDDFLEIITPIAHRDYVIGLWKRSQIKIGRWMQGQMLLVLIVGVFTYLGLTILGVPHALVLALTAALLEIIPVFGPVIAAIPGVGVAFVSGGVTLALSAAALYLILQQFENHLIYPLVVKKVVGVPALLVILALIIGAKLAGFLGIILSVPMAAVIREFVDDIQKGKQGKVVAIE